MSSQNPSFFSNFEVTAICSCSGGIVQFFDITPNDDVLQQLASNEYCPLDVYWYEKEDFTDYDDVKSEKETAFSQSKIFGLTLNSIYIYTPFQRHSHSLKFFIIEESLHRRIIFVSNAIRESHSKNSNG